MADVRQRSADSYVRVLQTPLKTSKFLAKRIARIQRSALRTFGQDRSHRSDEIGF